ncbi:MAG: DUF1501 domain-containing protein [Planctomycetaceae bacterium]|nr:DUF1501 domain-containing protein [Planctomycetaceae bacterium]
MTIASNRRQFLSQSGVSLGTLALNSLLHGAEDRQTIQHLPGKAKRIIYLFMHGGPSQLDLFDHKPDLRNYHGSELPASVRGDQRLTGMTSGQASFPVTSSLYSFSRHGQSGAWVSEVLPETAGIVDDICIIPSMHTEAINHDPALTLFQTGHQQPGRPSFGAWTSYGLGAENQNLPAFVVLLSNGSAARPTDPLYARLWGSGFLPSNHQGVAFRSGSDPVLYLSNSPGIDVATRRDQLDVLAALNTQRAAATRDPEIETRITQYEMAFRMQSSVPDLVSMNDESAATFDAYGPESRQPGTFARHCLLARRMAERGVRFIQLYHRGWDQHYNLPSDLRLQARDVDRPAAALIRDLKQRGMLEETLVIWGGEFGRTTYTQGKLELTNYGRDHHGRCFTMWLAGGGIKPGIVYGQTDDFCYNIAQNPVHVHDLNATLLHQLGVDHTRLTYRFQGRDYRLTDVHGNVVTSILS